MAKTNRSPCAERRRLNAARDSSSFLWMPSMIRAGEDVGMRDEAEGCLYDV